MKALLVLLLSLGLTACSSLSEKDCKQGDWQAIGQKDGKKGYNSDDRLESHQKACGEYGVTPNEDLYLKGYQVGIDTFCVQEGTKVGKKGDRETVHRQCRQSKKYVKAREAGYELFCKAEGVKAGKGASQKIGRKDCQFRGSYKKGYAEGLKVYCSESHGSKLGNMGAKHSAHECPRGLRKTFLAGYRQGSNIYCSRYASFVRGQKRQDSNWYACSNTLVKAARESYRKGIEYEGIKKRKQALDIQLRDLQSKINNPKTSPDLKAYLQKEKAQKQAQRDTLQTKLHKIEGYVGI